MESAPTALSEPVVQSGILPLFWDLAAVDEAVRLAAAEKLVTAIIAAQEDADAERPVDAEACRTEEALFTRCAPVVAYTVKRLLRGLPSSREGARQGFTAALIEVRAPSSPPHLPSYPPCPLLP